MENKTFINNRDDEAFNDIIQKVNMGYEHLSTYFTTFKDKHINRLLRIINSIKKSYEDSYNRNMNMLSLLQKLIDNYDGSVEMKNNILAHKINISKCKENANVEDLFTYYDEYNIIEKKKINIEEVKCIKTISIYASWVRSIILLKDKRIASCSRDQTIRIYNPSKDFHCEQIINRHSKGIESICELDDGTIVSCSWDDSIMIGDYTIRNAHDSWIFKVITLPNNRIASCSNDNTIKIWKSNPPYSNTPIKVLEGFNQSATSLLYIKERDIMISGGSILIVWNMSTYQCKTVIDDIFCCNKNSLYPIDNNRVVVGGFYSFCIVNIDKCVIEKKIKDESFKNVNCFLKLRDDTILCGCNDGLFFFYDMNREQTKIIKNNHNQKMNDLLMIDDQTFASCSDDYTIKIWKY